MPDALEPLKGFLHRVKGSVSRRRRQGDTGLNVVLDRPQAEIDIVAVHGLGDKGLRSWITQDPKSGSSKPWLQELLGTDFPNARIMTYSYASNEAPYRYIVFQLLDGCALNLAESLAALRLRDDTTKRPLFFIAHSLGGWIVKRALVLSSEATDPKLCEVELSTCGVAFFGTMAPGLPSSPSPLTHVIRKTSGFKEDVGVAPALQLQPEDFQWLERQMGAFKAIAANLPSISFYEKKKSGDSFVVEKQQSMAGSDGVQIGLVATHSDLIRFHGRDANYSSFIDVFRKMVSESIESGFTESKRKALDVSRLGRIDFRSLGYSVPYQIPNNFESIVARDDIMQQIDSVFNPRPVEETISFRFAHLWGRSGVGKTTMAKHYIQLHRQELSFIFWVWAESWETAAGSYLDFANRLVTHYSSRMPRERVEEQLHVSGVAEMVCAKSVLDLDKNRVMSVVRAVKDWLMQPGNDNWLVVFNRVEPLYNVQEFIPLTLSGRVILTSNDERACTWGSKIWIGSMTEDQALEMLNTATRSLAAGQDGQGDRLPRDYGQVEVNEDTIMAAKDLVRRLEGHPQSILQAASEIRTKKLSVTEYQLLLEETPTPSLFGSTIDQSPSSRLLLRVSSMLSSSAIPSCLFLTSLEPTSNAIMPEFSEVVAGLRTLQSQNNLNDVLQHLIDQHFIYPVYSSGSSQPWPPSSSPTWTDSSQTTCFRMDPDARKHVHGSFSKDTRVEHAWLACNICAEGVRQASDESSTLREVHSFGRVMAPHAKVCYEVCSPILEEPPELESISWDVLGNVCMTQGAVTQAIGCFGLALQHAGAMSSLERLQTSLHLSQLLEKIGDRDRSIEVLTAADLESVEDALGFQLALAKANANVAREKFSEAEWQFEALESEQEHSLGPTHAETVGTIQMLADTLYRMGKPQDAHALYRRVYMSYQKTFGPGHPMTLGSLDDLANICKCKEISSIEEAEALYKQSIDIKSRCLGPRHPRTALAIQNLAWIDDYRAQYSAAHAKYKQALEILLPTLGRAHPHCTDTMESMANSLQSHARFLEYHADLAPLPASSSTPYRRSSSLRRMADKEGSSSGGGGGSHAGAREAILGEATRQRAFQDAEKLYLEVVDIKRAAREMYSAASLVSTVSALVEMYETNSFFEAERADKLGAVRALLQEGR